MYPRIRLPSKGINNTERECNQVRDLQTFCRMTELQSCVLAPDWAFAQWMNFPWLPFQFLSHCRCLMSWDGYTIVSPVGNSLPSTWFQELAFSFSCFAVLYPPYYRSCGAGDIPPPDKRSWRILWDKCFDLKWWMSYNPVSRGSF